MTVDHSVSVVLIAFTAAVLAAAYCLPMMVAGRYRHRRLTAIALLNIFLGWTLLGWFLALAWAMTGNRFAWVTSAAESHDPASFISFVTSHPGGQHLPG